MTRQERFRLFGLAGAVAFLHLVGWGLFVFYSHRDVALAGLGTLAYTFGLRHAFDADHIAAIDNTTRKLLQEGKRPLGVGFFFSLGHSTIVFALAAGLAVAARTVTSRIPTLQGYGGYVGAGVSGSFLWLIGILNLLVLLDIVRVFREMRGGTYDRDRLEQRLLERGLMNRFLGRFARRVRTSWQMYPVGLLFGLGFDTATEVGLLALAAGVATHHVPILAVLVPADPLRSRDEPDGHRRRGLHEPGLRLGLLEPDPEDLLQHHGHEPVGRSRTGGRHRRDLQLAAAKIGLQGGVWSFLGRLDLGTLGYGIVAPVRPDRAARPAPENAAHRGAWGGYVAD